MRTFIAVLLVVGVNAGCGGSESNVMAENRRDHGGSSGSESMHSEDDGMHIEGLMGTLSQSEIQNALQPRMDRFAGCFAARYEELDLVGGDITFSFRIGLDGRVMWVYPSASTIGDREVERCLLEQANGARFPEPHGGEAEFSWPLGFDPPDDVRPAANWDGSHVADAVAENRGSVSACGGRGILVTAYIAPGGQVLAAGASISGPEGADSLDCVTEAVRSWTLPDPGSYPAKVTFEVN